MIWEDDFGGEGGGVELDGVWMSCGEGNGEVFGIMKEVDIC